MILPDFVLPSYVNQTQEFNGIDSVEYCRHPEHFKKYPHRVVYNYNSRGYRDLEWPCAPEELKNSIWCIGDSFTVGIGSPVDHTWTNILQTRLGRRTINVSLTGASNDWISRKTKSLLDIINPEVVILHWSYVERRELTGSLLHDMLNAHWEKHYNDIKGPDWPMCPKFEDFDQLPIFIKQELLTQHSTDWQPSDEDLRVAPNADLSWEQNVDNLINHISKIEQVRLPGTKIIHSFIPEFISKEYKKVFDSALADLDIESIPEFPRLDLARDGHHYDCITANYFVDQILTKL
jgi:hypothetical protein